MEDVDSGEIERPVIVVRRSRTKTVSNGVVLPVGQKTRRGQVFQER